VTIVFFISGHGFGHASRDVEVINALGSAAPAPRIIVRSAVSADLLRRTLRVPYELRPGACDTGIVQATSITHDDERTIDAALDFYRDWDARVEAESRALAGEAVSVIVGDVPPLAFEVAARLKVPSVAIANFTWDWIYETHPGFAARGGQVIRTIREAYRHATLALELPFAGGFEVFPSVRHTPLVARRATQPRAATRAHFGLPLDRPAVLLSFGGYGLPSLDLTMLDCLDEWTVVTTDRVSDASRALPAGVVAIVEAAFLTSEIRYEDLVAAADVVLTKPGYGILAECISTGTAMLYTSRGQFREYDVMVREMPRYVRCRFIDHADLFGGRWRAALETLRAQPPAPELMPTDGARVAARAILEIARG